MKRPVKEITLEELSLSSNNFASLRLLEEALAPFTGAQHCFAVILHVSLLVTTVKRIHDTIPNILLAVYEPDVQELLQDFLYIFYDIEGIMCIFHLIFIMLLEIVNKVFFAS
jgi:hypothetical protein